MLESVRNFRILRLEAATEGILKYFANFTGKYLCLSHFFNKLAGLRQIFAQLTNTFFHRTPPVAASIRPIPFWSKMKNHWNIYNKIWEKVSNIRSSHPEVFLEKGVLKICNKCTGEHPCQSVISMELLSASTIWSKKNLIASQSLTLNVPVPDKVKKLS